MLKRLSHSFPGNFADRFVWCARKFRLKSPCPSDRTDHKNALVLPRSSSEMPLLKNDRTPPFIYSSLAVLISLVFLSSCSNSGLPRTPKDIAKYNAEYFRAHPEEIPKTAGISPSPNTNSTRVIFTPSIPDYAPPSYTSFLPFLRSRSSAFSNPYDPNSLSNPYGAGSPYKHDGLLNSYSQYGSPYSNKSWNNEYATNAPKLYNADGKYLGRLSANRYDPESTSNPYGKYGSEFSPDSINNPYGEGSRFSKKPIYVVPQD